MIHIALHSKGAVDSGSLSSINTVTYGVIQTQTIESLNTRKPQSSSAQSTPEHLPETPRPQPVASQPNLVSSQTRPVQPAASRNQSGSAQTTPPQIQPVPAVVRRSIPPLRHMVQKGQKTTLENNTPLRTIKACLGWNTINPQCDVDVSAFMLGSNGKVPGDSWFVFYGQEESPDHSTVFRTETSSDRESITIHLDKLNPTIQKIVFVLTIHEAFEKRLHFGMLEDAYIRILNADNSEELVSFKMTEYYTNIISMMIGEIYNHNSIWKFNAIGNGVAKDLSGLCELYGVQVDG